MRKIAFFAIAALSLALISCSKEQMLPDQENGRTISMTLSASVNEGDDVKATMSAAWKFAFATGDKISLTNDQVTSGTYYELTRGSDGKFKGTVDAPVSAAAWYAYYPSNSVSLASQAGTQTGTAAYCALAGKQENVAAGSKSLNITLNFQTAILVVANTKGAIDINVKTSDGKWVSGFAATTNAATFDITKSDSKVSLFTSSSTGTHYIVVPAGVKIAVYDGETKIKETKASGLSAGKYYNVNVGEPLPAGALPGVFSVSNDGGKTITKIYFSQGNLFWNGSAFNFETNQNDDPQTDWDTPHVSYFYWSKSAEVAYAKNYSESGTSVSDVFFTNAEGFKVNVGGKDQTGWRALSTEEWQYLFNTRPMKNGKDRYTGGIIYGGKKGYVLYPDDYEGDPVSGEVTDLPDGAVFLSVMGGYRSGTKLYSMGNGFYWTSSPYKDKAGNACYVALLESVRLNNTDRNWGYCVRLVTECQ